MKKHSDISLMDNIKTDLGYTGHGDKLSKRMKFVWRDLPRKVAEIDSKVLVKEVSDDLEGKGIEFFQHPTHSIIILNQKSYVV